MKQTMNITFKIAKEAKKYFGICIFFCLISALIFISKLGYITDDLFQTLIYYLSGSLEINIKLVIWIFIEIFLLSILINLLIVKENTNNINIIIRYKSKINYGIYLIYIYICNTFLLISIFSVTLLFFTAIYGTTVGTAITYINIDLLQKLIYLFNYFLSIIIFLFAVYILYFFIEKIQICFTIIFSIQIVNIFLYKYIGENSLYLPFIHGLLGIYQTNDLLKVTLYQILITLIEVITIYILLKTKLQNILN